MPDEHDAERDPDLETTHQTPVGEDPQVVAGRYHILRTLGRGGGGIVWLARDEHLGREVALKRVSGEADAEVLVTRGLREARTSATLAHDHVVRVYDAFVHEGVPWIVMEHVPGPSLSSLLEGGRALPVPTVARIGAQVATALAAAHGAGIVHRDVKPGNVLLTDDSGTDAKLTDFGIARAEEDQRLTRTGMVSGTAAYFSPEMARGEDPTPASDVWALGATLYAAVEGRRPFPDAGNAVAQLHTIAREAPEPPRQAGPLTPVLRGMLDPDPGTRWTAARAAGAMAQVARGGHLPGGPAPAAVAGAAGAAAWETGWTAYHPQDGDPTQAVTSPDATRRVPVAGPGDARAASAASPAPRTTAGPGPRRQRRAVRPGVVLGWILGLLLAGLLAWLVWSIVEGGGSGDGAATTSTSDASAQAVDPEEAGQLARTFYATLAQDGLEAARVFLGPDAEVAADIADGLTRVAWTDVTTEPRDDGTVAVGITVTYSYGTTVYEQREDLVVARPEPGADPLIVSRVTGDPVVTSGGADDDADDTDDADGGTEDDQATGTGGGEDG